MAEAAYLTDHFLIAMPSMEDPNFSRTVAYVCQHDSDGALALVINRLAGFRLGDIRHRGVPEPVRLPLG